MGTAEVEDKPSTSPGFHRTARRREFVEQAAFWLLVGGLAWVPFWYGSNLLAAWGINAVLFPGLAALYEMSLLIRRKPHPVALRAIAVPAVLFAAVILWTDFQTVTWIPTRFANPIWGLTVAALGKPLEASISVNRDLTDAALVRLITAASVFWLSLQLCRDGARAARFIGWIVAIGAAYAVYGLVVLKTGQLPFLDIPRYHDNLSSTFVNHNSFATYAGMALVATAGLVLKLYQDELIDGGSWRLRLASFVETTGQKGALLLAGGFVILVALLLTGSRGGVISTGVGLMVVGALTWWRGRKRGASSGIVLVVAVVAGIAILFAFGGTFATSLDKRGLTDANRMSVYLLTLRSILDAPIFGFGYGTFHDVFPMYRDRSISVFGVWGQAHDTYLEVFQGLGLVVGSMLVGAVLLLALQCVKGSLRRRQNALVPQVAAGAACLVGVHALVDFSLQMQAVALTFAALLGAGVAQAESSSAALED